MTASRSGSAESFAFEMDVHVPVYGEDIEGLAWPQFQTDPEARAQKMCAMFSRVTEVRKALAGVHPNSRRFASIAGVEAFRWVWSAPTTVASIAVDYAQPGAFQFPVAWVRRVLFPAAADFDELSKVPAVPWPHIGKVPGARGLKPQILRTLALGWKPLLSVKEPVTVPFAGRRYVPVFSGQEQFFAFMSGPGAPRVTVDPAGKEPPFSRWLTSSGPCDGLLLDPTGGAPLALDPTDVLVISRWATHPSTPPTPGDVLADGARLAANCLGETEVEHLHRAVGAHLHIRGLEIAMDDPLFVRGLERVGDLLRDGEGVGERDSPVLKTRGCTGSARGYTGPMQGRVFRLRQGFCGPPKA